MKNEEQMSKLKKKVLPDVVYGKDKLDKEGVQLDSEVTEGFNAISEMIKGAGMSLKPNKREKLISPGVNPSEQLARESLKHSKLAHKETKRVSIAALIIAGIALFQLFGWWAALWARIFGSPQ